MSQFDLTIETLVLGFLLGLILTFTCVLAMYVDTKLQIGNKKIATIVSIVVAIFTPYTLLTKSTELLTNYKPYAIFSNTKLPLDLLINTKNVITLSLVILIIILAVALAVQNVGKKTEEKAAKIWR
jgi:hypothetical protein